MVALCALGGCFVQAKKAEWLQYKKVGTKQGSQTCIAGCLGVHPYKKNELYRVAFADDPPRTPGITRSCSYQDNVNLQVVRGN